MADYENTDPHVGEILWLKIEPLPKQYALIRVEIVNVAPHRDQSEIVFDDGSTFWISNKLIFRRTSV